MLFIAYYNVSVTNGHAGMLELVSKTPGFKYMAN